MAAGAGVIQQLRESEDELLFRMAFLLMHLVPGLGWLEQLGTGGTSFLLSSSLHVASLRSLQQFHTKWQRAFPQSKYSRKPGQEPQCFLWPRLRGPTQNIFPTTFSHQAVITSSLSSKEGKLDSTSLYMYARREVLMGTSYQGWFWGIRLNLRDLLLSWTNPLPFLLWNLHVKIHLKSMKHAYFSSRATLRVLHKDMLPFEMLRGQKGKCLPAFHTHRRNLLAEDYGESIFVPDLVGKTCL